MYVVTLISSLFANPDLLIITIIILLTQGWGSLLCRKEETVSDTKHQKVRFSNDQRKYCVVCYKQGRGQLRVNTCCPDQCGQFLHITRERNCFREWHSRDFHER